MCNASFTWIPTCLELHETHSNWLTISCCSLSLWYASSFFCDGDDSDKSGGGKAVGRNKVLKVGLLEVALSECSI